MAGVQILLFVLGAVINIYWRMEMIGVETPSHSRWLRNRCDFIFVIFLIAEFSALYELTIKDHHSENKLDIIALGMRISLMSISYGFVIQMKKYFLVIFIFLLLYLTLRNNGSANTYVTVIQIIVYFMAIIIITYSVRFSFKWSVESTYKNLILIYREIISDLAIRIQKSTNLREHHSIAKEI